MGKDERGYIVLETISAFLLFTLLVIAILSIISIVTVQARIHYAITQTCETVSMYSYILDLTGAASHIQKNSAKAGAVQGEKDKFEANDSGQLDGIKHLDPDQIGEKGESLLNQVDDVAGKAAADPKNFIQHLLNYGASQAGSQVFELLVRPLVGRYLSNGELSGDQYLRSYGVIGGLDGLDFAQLGAHNSELLTASGNVKIVVQYDVEYSFGALILPFDEPKLHITQEVMTKAWLGGEGKGYTG